MPRSPESAIQRPTNMQELSKFDTSLAKDEIERKYIIKTPPPNLENYPQERIAQGYTPDGRRYRIAETPDGPVYTTTIKFGNGVKRQEIEENITREEFLRKWPTTFGTRLLKDRYFIRHDNGTEIHFDMYLKGPKGGGYKNLEGYMVAEPEFDTIARADAFVPPDWFRTKKGKILEVTGKRGYSNKDLARFGWPRK